MPSVQIEHHLNLDPELPEDIKKFAIEHGECDDTTQETVSKFRSYILEQDNCQPYRMDDEYLIKFLRARYWKIEPSYKLLCNYYKFREQNKSYYEKVHPFDLELLGEHEILSATPYRDQHGHRIVIYRFGMWKPKEVSVDDIFRVTLTLLELGSLEPIAQVMGGIAIFDLKDLTANHLFHLSPSIAQKMIALLVTSMPYRTAALHIVNQNWVFSVAFNVFKPFLDAAMREKLYIHGSDMKSLHKHIDPDHLPKRYGGIHDDYSYKTWIDNLRGNSKLQKELEQAGYVFN